MQGNGAYEVSNADWQRRMRIASYVGTVAADTDTPTMEDVAIKVAFALAVLGLILGALA